MTTSLFPKAAKYLSETSGRFFCFRVRNVSGGSRAESLILPAAVGGVILGALFSDNLVYASDDAIPPVKYPWHHSGFFGSYDTASLRRGYEVYRQVCSTCHAMEFLHYRNLVGNTHTEEQAKALAASIKVKDFDDKGEAIERPGKLPDQFPKPYDNEDAARAANGGALPPDLSLIVKGRGSGDHYVFSILTGYRDPPVGVKLRQGLYYNPYFSGGAISMAKALQPDGVEYEDGTVATISQQAKDVTEFLTWAADPKRDERKKTAIKLLSLLVVTAAGAGYWKRFRWSVLKSRRISWAQ